MSNEKPRLTSEFTLLPDPIGEQVLSGMEIGDKDWQVVLKDQNVTMVDFANWLQIDEQRQSRFAAVRAKSPLGV